MKKLIKLLFPRTYDSIYREGFSYCYKIYVTPEDLEEYYASDGQDYYIDDEEFIDEYPEDYWEEAPILYEESEVEAAAINIPKLEIGDKVHLHSKNGIYTVSDMYIDSFAYTTSRAKKEKYADYSDYKCHAGGIYNKGE
jgi:hypothetical protein